jgi:hypothetical protein
MSIQIPLIPVSASEFTQAAYRLAQLLQQVEDEEASWLEAREGHKGTMAVYKKAIGEQRATIRRAQLEREDGLMQEQVDALLNHEEERRS